MIKLSLSLVCSLVDNATSRLEKYYAICSHLLMGGKAYLSFLEYTNNGYNSNCIDSNQDILQWDNSKKNASECDLYIKEVRFRSKTTRRKRVIYKCTYPGCSKKCQKRWNLIDHIKVHLNITPYQCEICDTKFVQKGNLKKHSRMHNVPDLNERKKYKWTICGKAYTERYNLTHHLVSEHKTTKLSVKYVNSEVWGSEDSDF